MLGVHVRREGKNIVESLKKGLPKFAKSAQIFVLNPFSGAEIIGPNDIEDMREFVARTGIDVIVHGSYVDAPWKDGSIELIRREIELAARLGCCGLVVHLGAGTNKTIEAVIRGIIATTKADYLEQIVLWLEINSAKANVNTFETPEKINRLFGRIEVACRGSPLLVGLCVDTAHLWACGVSMKTYGATMRWLKAVKARPIMFHLNDSSEPIGSGKDIHAPLCEGQIWSDFNCRTVVESGIAAVLNFATKNNSIVILERHTSDVAKDVKILKCLGFSF